MLGTDSHRPDAVRMPRSIPSCLRLRERASESRLTRMGRKGKSFCLFSAVLKFFFCLKKILDEIKKLRNDVTD